MGFHDLKFRAILVVTSEPVIAKLHQRYGFHRSWRRAGLYFGADAIVSYMTDDQFDQIAGATDPTALAEAARGKQQGGSAPMIPAKGQSSAGPTGGRPPIVLRQSAQADAQNRLTVTVFVAIGGPNRRRHCVDGRPTTSPHPVPWRDRSAADRAGTSNTMYGRPFFEGTGQVTSESIALAFHRHRRSGVAGYVGSACGGPQAAPTGATIGGAGIRARMAVTISAAPLRRRQGANSAQRIVYGRILTMGASRGGRKAKS